ncbi:hypothetical protein KM043_018097 [Ampulex compressa]|nr:hypothetical protein KM043_018097 [Ampulex compressa]
MQFATLTIIATACLVLCATAEELTRERQDVLGAIGNPQIELEQDENVGHVREKRTLFLKKKLLGAGLLGFGLGIAKGYKAGYYSAPNVHHVYLSPPPPAVKYVEYVEKPVYVERVIERHTGGFKPVHVEYEPATVPQKNFSPAYGSW